MIRTDLGGSDRAELERRLVELRGEHRDLDQAIEALLPSGNQVRIQRLKKRKLALRDHIAHLQAGLHPDIIA